MAFPSLREYPINRPGPYERQMGAIIANLVRLYVGHVPDDESNAAVLELARSADHWTAGHAVFDEVRRRALAVAAAQDDVHAAQYAFEEVCAQALYNACNPRDPFDPSSPFFVVGFAFTLGSLVGIRPDDVLRVVTAPTR